jgi:hypothetical protein
VIAAWLDECDVRLMVQSHHKETKMDAETEAMALNIWNRMTEIQQHNVRFGIIPLALLEDAIKGGYKERELAEVLTRLSIDKRKSA